MFYGNDIEVSNGIKKSLKPLKISEEGQSPSNFKELHFCKYPIVYFDMKDTVADNYDEHTILVYEKLSDAFKEHQYLMKSEKLNAEEVKTIEKYIFESGKITWQEHFNGLANLGELLSKHHEKKCLYLLDGHDEAINYTYSDEFNRGDCCRK